MEKTRRQYNKQNTNTPPLLTDKPTKRVKFDHTVSSSSSSSSSSAVNFTSPTSSSATAAVVHALQQNVNDKMDVDENDDNQNDTFVRNVDNYNQWKSHIPYLYDVFLHTNLEWPSYACAWGIIQQYYEYNNNNNASSSSSSSSSSAVLASPLSSPLSSSPSLLSQWFYFSRSTSATLERDRWIGSPNMLLRGEVTFCTKYHTQDCKKMNEFDEDQKSPFLNIRKKIVHPGEVNRIKPMPQYPDIVATHTDSPLVYIWNTATQPSRRSTPNIDPNVPDLTLQGHEDGGNENALYYALDCSRHHPYVISGGSDCKICLWSIEDYCSSLMHNLTLCTIHQAEQPPYSAYVHHSSLSNAPTAASGSSSNVSRKAVERLLSPRMIFRGHTQTIEEVQFAPHHESLLTSVGDDRLLLLFDQRVGQQAVVEIHTSHTDDVNGVSWNSINTHLLVTGSSDTTCKLFDLRRVSNDASFLSSPSSQQYTQQKALVHTFHGHHLNVTNVQWHPNGVLFASGGEDGDVCVWDIRGVSFGDFTLQRQSTHNNNNNNTDNTNNTTFNHVLPPKSVYDNEPLDNRGKCPPDHLLFRHSGHRTACCYFTWNNFVADGWTMCSLSDDSSDSSLVGGGRLHIWRPTDFLTKPYTQALEEMKKCEPKLNDKLQSMEVERIRQEQRMREEAEAAATATATAMATSEMEAEEENKHKEQSGTHTHTYSVAQLDRQKERVFERERDKDKDSRPSTTTDRERDALTKTRRRQQHTQQQEEGNRVHTHLNLQHLHTLQSSPIKLSQLSNTSTSTSSSSSSSSATKRHTINWSTNSIDSISTL